jgi:23S rRNA (guanosine2251-2'-O)-methyltransferase
MSKRKPAPKPAGPPDAARSRRKSGGPRAAERKARSGRHAADAGDADSALWLWGGHAVLEALANPRRRLRRVVLAGETVETWEPPVAERLEARAQAPKPEIVARHEVDRFLPAGAVHQGLAVLAEPLDQPDLATLAGALPDDTPAAVLLLDQVSDPHNVGAVLRSAAAFGAVAVVTTRRNAPGETGALAKTASGALEHVPYLRETNLARAMGTLQHHGFRVLGLAQEAETLLAAAAGPDRVALVLGAEGGGLRAKTRDTCDALVRLPTGGPVAELNVSNAAAVALYELVGRRGH